MSFTCLACKVRQDFVQQVQVDERSEEKSAQAIICNRISHWKKKKKRLEMTYICKCQQNLGCVDLLPNMSRLGEERSDEESPGGRSKQAKQGGDSSLVPRSEWHNPKSQQNLADTL